MIRVLIAAAAALAFASAAHAGNAGYSLDAKGKCHDAKGRFAAASHCQAPKAPHCTKGVPCGDTCIAKGKVCHVH